MRLGLFGGTFDPIHLGHLILAEACREACRLDRVWFIVTADPPHKTGARTPVSHRLEMTRLAIAGNPHFEVSEIEAKRPGPHYSFETLETIQRERPGDELFFLVGADSLADFPTWRHPERITAAATIVVIDRPGQPRFDKFHAHKVPFAYEYARAPLIEISSTDIRESIATNRSIRYRVPRAVEAYIEAHALYHPSDRIDEPDS